MKPDQRTGIPDFHGFPREVDNFARYDERRLIVGKDEIYRTKISLPGNYQGKKGDFEWIIEPNGVINHRLFKAE